jgi:hypothetical protein
MVKNPGESYVIGVSIGPNVIVTLALAAMSASKPPEIKISLVMLLTLHLFKSNVSPSYSTLHVSRVKLSNALVVLG